MLALFITVTKLQNLETLDASVHMLNADSVAPDLRVEPLLVLSKFAAFGLFVGRKRIGVIEL